MRLSSAFIGALAALFSVVHAEGEVEEPNALGFATVINRCLGVKASLLVIAGGRVTDDTVLDGAENPTYTKQYDNPDGRGVHIVMEKVPNDPPEPEPRPQMDLHYRWSKESDDVAYTLTTENGDPFAGHNITLYSSDAGCDRIEWPDGTEQAGSGGLCGASANLTLEMCGYPQSF